MDSALAATELIRGKKYRYQLESGEYGRGTLIYQRTTREGETIILIRRLGATRELALSSIKSISRMP